MAKKKTKIPPKAGPPLAEKKQKKKRKRKYPNMRGKSAPEFLLFGLILTSAILFSVSCLQSSRQISTSFSMTTISPEKKLFEKKIQRIVKGYPIEQMSPFISRKDKRVASFIVAIAKKESNWGRHTPKLAGRECFNYWGYRGPENPTPSGYSCFDSPQQAVDVVGNRITELVAQKIDTPKEMVAWKCGTASCARRDRGAAKWIWDVGFYFNKIYPHAKNKEIAFK